MKEWIISITAVILITNIVCLILPQDKIGRYIKSIFSLLTMLVVIKPIINLKDFSFDYDKIVGANEIVLQDDFLEYLCEEKVDEYEKKCVNIAEKLGVKNASVDIEYKIDTNKSVNISLVNMNLQNSVIISNKPHIYIREEMITEIASYLNINKDMVVINE